MPFNNLKYYFLYCALRSTRTLPRVLSEDLAISARMFTDKETERNLARKKNEN